MLLFNGDVEIISENNEWIVYGVKAMDYLYAVKIPIKFKLKAESSKQKLKDVLKQHGLDFKDLVIDIRKEKGRNYNTEIKEKSNGTRPKKEKAKASKEHPKLF